MGIFDNEPTSETRLQTCYASWLPWYTRHDDNTQGQARHHKKLFLTNVCSNSSTAAPHISHPSLGHAGNLRARFLPNIYGNQANTTCNPIYNMHTTSVPHVLWYFWCGSDWKNVVQRWWIPAGGGTPSDKKVGCWGGPTNQSATFTSSLPTTSNNQFSISVCLLRVSQHVRDYFKHLSHRFLPRGQIYEVSVCLELKKINWVSKCNPILFQGTGLRSSITSATIEFLVWINPTLCAPCSPQ